MGDTSMNWGLDVGWDGVEWALIGAVDLVEGVVGLADVMGFCGEGAAAGEGSVWVREGLEMGEWVVVEGVWEE